MKLAYLYVADHRILSEVGIPISGEHRCHYIDGKLSLGLNEDRVEYYNGLSCSAIIGKNGVGKSTILDFVESSYGATDSSGLIVFFDSENVKYHICPINTYFNDSMVTSGTDFIVESDFKRFVKKHNVKFVKSNNLTGVEESKFKYKKNYNGFVCDLSLSQYAHGTKSEIVKRTNRLIDFFKNSQWFEGFERTKIKFSFKFKASSVSYLNSLLNDKDFVKKNIDSDKDLSLLRSVVRNSINEFSLHEEKKSIVDVLVRGNILSILSYVTKTALIKKGNQNSFFIKMVLMYYKENLEFSDLSGLLLSGDSKFYARYGSDILMADSFVIVQRYEYVIDTIFEIAKNLSFDRYVFDGENSMSTFDSDFIIDLTSLISKLPSNISSNFSYGWGGFSTGEFAKLNIFSELYNYIKSDERDSRENHIIIMDEVDLYLHPDWQRTFFSEMLEFLSSEASIGRIQLILSTHSPLIVGDFLPEDIISLEVDGSGRTEVVESFGFGSQVTDLYLDGMHLRSTFGEHSKKVITGIIGRRDEDTLTNDDVKLVKKIKNRNIQNMLLGAYDKS